MPNINVNTFVAERKLMVWDPYQSFYTEVMGKMRNVFLYL